VRGTYIVDSRPPVPEEKVLNRASAEKAKARKEAITQWKKHDLA